LEIKGRGYPFCYGADYVYDSSPAIQDLKLEIIINSPGVFSIITKYKIL
jgi:hypothetical protein